MKCLQGAVLFLGFTMAISASAQEYSGIEPVVIPMGFAIGEEGKGSVIAADLDGDGSRELVVTAPGKIGAYTLEGERIWLIEVDVRVSAGSSERHGLPGHHAPGVQVADIDGNGKNELLYLDQSSTVHIHDAATAEALKSVKVPHPDGAARWEHLAVANLRGEGDRDLILQATNQDGYRVGHYVAAYAIDALGQEPLWKNDHFGALAHGPLRLADLNLDGKDEVIGFTILGPDGSPTDWQYPPIDEQYAGGASFHIDSIFIYDVRPDVPGLEVVLLEEGRNYLALANLEHGLLWWETNNRTEPQNAAVGEFDRERPGLEIWCRSRFNTDQKPWVVDARGAIIARYELKNTAPPDWPAEGIETIVAIDWTGEEKQLIAAKARHTVGDVCLVDPMTGRFLDRFDEEADRLYVADVLGDWREELIVINHDEVHVYQNPDQNPRPDQPRLWQQPHYRRNKMTWNYYSP